MLAERSGVSADTIGRLERGVKSPNIDTLVRLCVGLDLSVSTFFAALELPDNDCTREVVDLLGTRSPRERTFAMNMLHALFTNLDRLHDDDEIAETSTMKSITLSLSMLACVPTPETCEEVRSGIGYDDPSPAGTTPREIMEYTESTRYGTLTWGQGGSIGQLSPSGTETPITVTTTLDTNSAIVIDRVHVGVGRLACVDLLVIQATLTISTADGALQESFGVEFEAKEGVIGGVVEGKSNLSMHQFAGALTWQPSDAAGELFLRTSWTADPVGTLRGWLVWGDPSQVEVTGIEVEGEGVGLVLAEFAATVESGE